MRKLASIQTIANLEPIDGADNIEKATVLGWHLVVKKGDFSVGSQCVFCEIDSVLPDKPEFEFLRNRGYRIRTIRLRSQISQGIAFPIDILPKDSYAEGDDVTEILGITKWEPKIPACLAGRAKGPFPNFIAKTDETRIQAEPQVLERHKDKSFQVTEKLDGSSATIYIRDGVFGVCSRNLELKEDDKNTFWKIARSFDLENRLKSFGKNIAVQGELIGEGIQKNRYEIKGHDFYVFNIFSIDNFCYCDAAMTELMATILKLKYVPVICNSFRLGDESIDDLVEFSQKKSSINIKINQEGCVFKSRIEMRDPDLGRLSFKVLNPNYLLKYEE